MANNGSNSSSSSSSSICDTFFDVDFLSVPLLSIEENESLLLILLILLLSLLLLIELLIFLFSSTGELLALRDLVVSVIIMFSGLDFRPR